jgi:hypothetical protein
MSRIDTMLGYCIKNDELTYYQSRLNEQSILSSIKWTSIYNNKFKKLDKIKRLNYVRKKVDEETKQLAIKVGELLFKKEVKQP